MTVDRELIRRLFDERDKVEAQYLQLIQQNPAQAHWLKRQMAIDLRKMERPILIEAGTLQGEAIQFVETLQALLEATGIFKLATNILRKLS